MFDTEATLYEGHDLDVPIDVGSDSELLEMDLSVDSEPVTAMEPEAGDEFPHSPDGASCPSRKA
jgi:hypothetical protein